LVDEWVARNYSVVFKTAITFSHQKAEPVIDLWEPLVQLVKQLGIFLGLVLQLVFSWSLLIVWVAWWLWGVNWRKVWPVLAQGAWVPVVLLTIVAALVWSELAPGSSFLWRLADTMLLVAVALFCGWLQGVMGWTPAEIDLEPAAPVAAHEHH
jgi:hypothetical protein